MRILVNEQAYMNAFDKDIIFDYINQSLKWFIEILIRTEMV